MTTDRELLEMAARAAGLSYHSFYRCELTGEWGINIRAVDVPLWNPILDDAHAFRLLRDVDYGLLVEDSVVKIVNNLGGCQFFTVIENTGDIDDEMKVIRWAVVNAAAIKGRLMP